MSELNKAFKADDEITDPEINFRTSLDLSGKPAGSYYFNEENNYEYTKNWFNYKKFNVVGQDTIVNELVQYGSPALTVGNLDTSKTYELPSTTMTPQWLARITRDKFTSRSPGYSGVDLAGNTYLMTGFGDDISADVYSSNNVLSFSETTSTYAICLAKYNSAGIALWSVKIDDNAYETFCVTDNQGTTYIAGYSLITGSIKFEDASGTVIFNVPIPQNSGFLVAYNSSGTPDWVTRTDAIIRVLAVDNQTVGNVYGILEKGGGFYDGVTVAPVVVLTVPNDADLVVAKWRSSSGLFQWASYLTGYRLFINGRTFNPTVYKSQCSVCDQDGNLILTGYYTKLDSIYEGRTPTDATWIESNLTLPPYSNQVVWTPHDQDREWSAVTLSDSGQYMYATVQNGFIYVSSNYGQDWVPRATQQNWSALWCSSTGQFVVATIMDSVIYVSGDYGASWSIAAGEGSNARAWISVSGNATGSQLVACAQNDNIYYSTDQGASWTVSTSVIANWIDVAYSVSALRFIAIVKNGQWYQSTDGGITWGLIVSVPPVPTADWSAICASRFTGGTSIFQFFITENNGAIYGWDVFSGSWTIVNATSHAWTDIACNATSIFATVFDGAIYQATQDFIFEWTPTTIPRNWNRVAMVTDYAIASGFEDQVYVTTSFFPLRHTCLFKYNPDGVVQWANYVNSPQSNETNNSGVCLTTQSNKNIILCGNAGVTNEFFMPSDFVNPVKVLNTTVGQIFKYIASYSPEGIPLWTNKIRMDSPTFDPMNEFASMAVDNNDNIYCIGTSESVYTYNPTGQLVFQDTNLVIGKAILLKYYPNGFFQSYAYLTWVPSDIGRHSLNGTSVHALGQGEIYLSGCAHAFPDGYTVRTMNAYAQLSAPPVVTMSTPICVFASRYSSSTLSWITFPNPGYNLVFQPQFAIGGSTRNLINGYTGDGSIEIWGGKTGLPPSAVDTSDLNASVVSYLGHVPGYTIPIVEGIQTLNPKIYNHLTVGISEPSFPEMDPQPVTPGTIPYGFLPIFVSFPFYTSGLTMNNSNNNQTNAILSATGIVSGDNLFASGVSAGDKVRFLLNTPTSTQYLTLTVVGFIGSELIGNVQTGIVFEESTRYVSTVLGTTVNATAALIIVGNDRYAPMFWQPILVEDGTLNLIVQLYPQFTN